MWYAFSQALSGRDTERVHLGVSGGTAPWIGLLFVISGLITFGLYARHILRNKAIPDIWRYLTYVGMVIGGIIAGVSTLIDVFDSAVSPRVFNGIGPIQYWTWFWIVIPPIFFFTEYFVFFRAMASGGGGGFGAGPGGGGGGVAVGGESRRGPSLEEFKHGQQVAAAIWLALVTLLGGTSVSDWLKKKDSDKAGITNIQNFSREADGKRQQIRSDVGERGAGERTSSFDR
jgi:hypothetical protein